LTSVAHTWGSTATERDMPLPCDMFLPHATDSLFRAVDVEAPAPVVFRWLCQLRVAPYSYDLLDNFGRRSPRQLTPGLEHLELGQRFMRVFDLVAFAPDRHITLRLRASARKLFGEVVITYLVREVGEGRGRLLVKIRTVDTVRLRKATLPWGDLVMMRRQLLNLKHLAETA
jgi:hypothetical protein